MRVAGIIAWCIAALLMAVALTASTSVPSEPTSFNGYSTAGTLNIGLLQQQNQFFMASLAAAVIGAILYVGGAIVGRLSTSSSLVQPAAVGPLEHDPAAPTSRGGSLETIEAQEAADRVMYKFIGISVAIGAVLVVVALLFKSAAT